MWNILEIDFYEYFNQSRFSNLANPFDTLKSDYNSFYIFEKSKIKCKKEK